MKSHEDPNRCRILVTGDELVELKRHAHQLPECPGLERRIEHYNGKGRLVMSREELDWIVAVLDAVLHDPKGYPCVEYRPWQLEYVPRTSECCVACRRLYERLDRESERLSEISLRQWRKLKKQEQARERRQVERDRTDLTMSAIQAVFRKRGCPAILARVNRGHTIYHDGRAVSRIRQRDKCWEVLWWSSRNKWDSIGDMGGMMFSRAKEAAEYVLDDPMGVFWR